MTEEKKMSKIVFLEAPAPELPPARSDEEFELAKDELERYAMYDPADRGEMPFYTGVQQQKPAKVSKTPFE